MDDIYFDQSGFVTQYLYFYTSFGYLTLHNITQNTKQKKTTDINDIIKQT